ncbi:S-layer homology domain-containing protein [Paenibacillus filicis]|uniref:S-layer homology domain-containing protein n=1 Tax=Paenibacillus filicis TaxID=669464 RepID=A0ABU9DRL1_9BACL
MNHRFLKTVSASALLVTLLAGAQTEGVYAASAATAGSGAAVSSTSTASNPHGIADGTYSIEYKFQKFNTDQVSVMQEYVVNPGKLIIKNGAMTAQVTLKQSKEITVFKLESGGSLVTPETASADEASNTRTVQFEVKDLTAKLKGWVKIYWQVSPTFLYDHEYDIHLTFDKSTLKEIAASTNPPAAKSEPSGTGQPAAGSTGNEKSPDKAVPQEKPAQSDSPATGSQPASGSLRDLNNHWAQAAIERAVSLGIANGYEDGTFKPNGEINRAEFTTLLSRALKLEAKGDELSFTDLKDIPAWVQPHLAPVVKAGIIGGYEDGSFRADRKISRAELAVIVVRAMKLAVDASAKPDFADADRIPQWAQAEVAAAHQAGVISGRDGNLFAPAESATRAEAVSLILALSKEAK